MTEVYLYVGWADCGMTEVCACVNDRGVFVCRVGRLWNDRGRVVVVVALLFYIHSKYLMSCRDGQLT